MTIRAVYFDLGGVILRTEDKGPRTELAQSLGLDYAGMDQAVFGPASIDASIGAMSEEQHWRNVVRAFNLPESEVARVRQAFFAGDRIDYNIVDFLRSLRPTYKIGLISNAWSGLREWIIAQKIDDAFDHLTISAEFGSGKPEPDIYRHALAQFNVRPEEAVFVDDMPANVAAANALGMHGILFKTAEQTIDGLKTLLAA
jgi:putative hydrolase of the HAD superfamily